MKIIFWISFITLFYIFIGYPIFLYILGLFNKKDKIDTTTFEPKISIIIPVYNEEKNIGKKLKNTFTLKYPDDKLEIIVVSDASTDRTNDIVSQIQDNRLKFLIQPQRYGKANALNRGLSVATNEIIVFSDASIILELDALPKLVRGFESENIGCISGEDYIPGGGGEGAYGKYELFLRNLESRANSIVGASGCFYAQRRDLCDPFPVGMAPDFFSVLKTVEKGFKAITEPNAKGAMESVGKSKQEFERKIRTLVRGMTTLMAFKHLMNPSRYGIFAIELLSHKILRWSAGVFLLLLFISNLFLLNSVMLCVFFLLQLLFYLFAVLGWFNVNSLSRKIFIKIPFYFCLVNFSALLAWVKYFKGYRQEIWEPSKR